MYFQTFSSLDAKYSLKISDIEDSYNLNVKFAFIREFTSQVNL